VGVLYDYFRMPDNSAVLDLMASTHGGSPLTAGRHISVDVVDAKHIEPAVTLGKLVACALEVPFRLDLMDGDLVWPPGMDESYEGAFVCSVPDLARDGLAGIADEDLRALAARWAQIEELAWSGSVGPTTMLPILTDLVGLARRANGADEHLYFWCSV